MSGQLTVDFRPEPGRWIVEVWSEVERRGLGVIYDPVPPGKDFVYEYRTLDEGVVTEFFTTIGAAVVWIRDHIAELMDAILGRAVLR